MNNHLSISHIRLTDDEKGVVILDQSLLPGTVEYIELRSSLQMYEAIKTLRVRGAPALGIFAGFAIYSLASQLFQNNLSSETFIAKLRTTGDYLSSSRPTAVNLSWAVNRMLSVCTPDVSEEQNLKRLKQECQKILDEDIQMCTKISEYGLSLLHDGDSILTHCNAGPIATSKYGTAIGPIILGKEKGFNFHVFADETRPLLQGARLTSWELNNHGIDVTLICDNMASAVMQQGLIKYCFVGCDRIAANGDTANKIGTSGVAILAKHYGIPFYVLGPTSTVDLKTPSGKDINIEMRDGEEIRSLWFAKPMSPAGIQFYNPAFDITDHELISGIITEKGICRPPYTKSLAKLFN